MDRRVYDQTTSAIARGAECSSPTVTKYADEGWLDYITASNGCRLYPASEKAKAREIKAQRLANRGGNRRRA